MSLAETPTAPTNVVPIAATPAASPAPTPAPTAAPTAKAPALASDPPERKVTTGGAPVVTEPTHDIPEKVDSLLVKILTWPRKDGTPSEMKFCGWLRGYLDSMGVKKGILNDPSPAIIDDPTWQIMAHGCLVVTVPRPAPKPSTVGATWMPKPSTTLFSCHIDTVEGHDSDEFEWTQGDGGHWTKTPKAKDDDARKKLNYDPNFGLIGLEKDSIGGSLGADDGAGVWLMLNMIERKVPGTYIFHRSEEVGGVGSRAMADKHAKFLEQFECAVAFDRHDTYEVIYMQGGMKCASMKFTDALCARLNSKGMKYEPSSRGVFTDTKNYRKIIPECVNIAVGYQGQHGRGETLDYAHLSALLEALCAIDWDSLPIDRDPKEFDSYGGYSGASYGRGRTFVDDDDADLDTWLAKRRGGTGGTTTTAPHFDKSAVKPGAKKRKGQAKPPAQPELPFLSVSDELATTTLEELEFYAEQEPFEAAKLIGQLLMEIEQLKATRNTLMRLMGWAEQ